MDDRKLVKWKERHTDQTDSGTIETPLSDARCTVENTPRGADNRQVAAKTPGKFRDHQPGHKERRIKDIRRNMPTFTEPTKVPVHPAWVARQGDTERRSGRQHRNQHIENWLATDRF